MWGSANKSQQNNWRRRNCSKPIPLDGQVLIVSNNYLFLFFVFKISINLLEKGQSISKVNGETSCQKNMQSFHYLGYSMDAQMVRCQMVWHSIFLTFTTHFKVEEKCDG